MAHGSSSDGSVLRSAEGVRVGVAVGSTGSAGQHVGAALGSSVGVDSSVRHVGNGVPARLVTRLGGCAGLGWARPPACRASAGAGGAGGSLAVGTTVGPAAGSAAAAALPVGLVVAVRVSFGGRAPAAAICFSGEPAGVAARASEVDPSAAFDGCGTRIVCAAHAPKVGVDPSPVTSAVSKTVFQASTSRR